MTDLRQLQPGEKIRVVIDGNIVNATVTQQPEDYVHYRFFSDGLEHTDGREVVYPAGEEQRLIKRLLEIRASARLSIQAIRKELQEATP